MMRPFLSVIAALTGLRRLDQKRSRRPPNLFLTSFDTDGDGTLSAAEICVAGVFGVQCSVFGKEDGPASVAAFFLP